MSTQTRLYLALVGSLLMTLVASLPATAVRLDSSGENNEYVGIANFAFSYSSTPYLLTGQCFAGSADDSQWSVQPSSCDTETDSSCWATTCESTYGECIGGSDAYISMQSMRKGLVQYYARDHKDSGQGWCNFTIGSSSFSINFDYQDTGVDFSLALIPGEGGWTTEGTCPEARFTANTDVENQYNLICNEDFVVSLAGDPSISNGVGISVTNSPDNLSYGGQEYTPQTTRTTANPNTGNEPRRFATRRIGSDRWLVVSDTEGDSIRGTFVAGTPGGVTEFVACDLQSGDTAGDLTSTEEYDYRCRFTSLDGLSQREEQIRLPSSFLRIGARTGPEGPRRASSPDVVSQVGVAIRDFAPAARVIEADGATTWHGEKNDSRVMLFERSGSKYIDAATHSPKALSPVFMTCSEYDDSDPLNPDFSCRATTRCTGSPCALESWSPAYRLELPRALFKSRPCLPEQGGEAKAARLKLSHLDKPAGSDKLQFRARVTFPDGSVVRPDENGFRLLVEDANGHSVTDLDIPSTQDAKEGKRGGKKLDRWRVQRGGKRFRYTSKTPNGGIIPDVDIKQKDRKKNRWEIRVRGRGGDFDGAALKLPLTASLTVSPRDPNSNVCSTVNFASPSESSQGSNKRRGCKRRRDGSKISCR